MNLRVKNFLRVPALVLALAPSTLTAGALEGAWNDLEPSGGSPADRGAHSAIYDPVAHRMIIFGGWSGSIYNSLNDTWALDLNTNTWSQVSTSGGPPSRRAGHVAVYDSLRHRMVVYGGGNWWSTGYNDTWALDLVSHTWTQLSTTGGPPSKRIVFGGFYDAAHDRLVIFGGQLWGRTFLNDTWSLEPLELPTRVWTQVATTGGPPAPRAEFASSYDSSNHQFVVSAGWGGGATTWLLDSETFAWSQAASAPYAFAKSGTAFDGSSGRMIMVAAEYGIPPDSMALVYDVWSNTWFDVNVPGATPPMREVGDSSAIFDPVGQRTIMFGGCNSLSVCFNDTWELLLTGQGDCCTGDLDQDGDVDLGDFAIFQAGFTGPQ